MNSQLPNEPLSYRDRSRADSIHFHIDEFDDDHAADSLLGPMPDDTPRQPKTPRGLPAYLAALWAVPLLSEKQEKHCFRKLNYLKYLHSLPEDPTQHGNNCSNEHQTITPAADYDEQILRLRNQIVLANLRLVVSIAKKRAAYGSNEFDEMVGVGNTALMRAVDLFDFRRGFRFSTYAHRAIQSAIFSAFRKEGRLRGRFVACGNEATESAVGDAAASDFAILKAAEVRDQVIGLMQKLDERDRKIVMERFGINRKHDGVAFHVIAKKVGLSTTRTVQLFHRSVGQMRECLGKRCSANAPIMS